MRLCIYGFSLPIVRDGAAVHCVKDLPTILPTGIGMVLRGSTRCVIVHDAGAVLRLRVA